MTHFTVLVTGPDVESALAPFDENDEGAVSGEWDYWRIGGRWAGHLPLRNGRAGYRAPLSWEWAFNGSDPSSAPDPRHFADTAVKRDVNLEALDPTFAIVHEGKWLAREIWDGANWVTTPDWDQQWHGLVSALPDDTILTVVDCHV